MVRKLIVGARGALVMTLLLLGVACVWGEAVAQQSSDMEKVKAASQAFYAALNTRDPSAMAKVWAHTPYVIHISPVAKEIVVGWDGVNKSWEEVHNMTSQINISFSETGVPQIDGKLAWEVGTETGPVTFADGKAVNLAAFATNIYQNIDGRWLIVSHQAGQIPR